MILTIKHRDEYNKDPTKFHETIQYIYKVTTGTGCLHTHIENHHLELYLQLCTKHRLQPSTDVIGKPTVVVEDPTPGSSCEPLTVRLCSGISEILLLQTIK